MNRKTTTNNLKLYLHLEIFPAHQITIVMHLDLRQLKTILTRIVMRLSHHRNADLKFVNRFVRLKLHPLPKTTLLTTKKRMPKKRLSTLLLHRQIDKVITRILSIVTVIDLHLLLFLTNKVFVHFLLNSILQRPLKFNRPY
jgi:hypothetical protein